MFKQVKRLADAERSLALKETKKALNDQRIATNKISQHKGWLADLKREEPKTRDSRIFQDVYSCVILEEDGKRWVRPLRYHLRPFWMPASSDRTKEGRPSGKYNARRDNLEVFWKRLFASQHGLMVASQFWESVTIDGKSQILEYEPRTGEPMLVASLWSHWSDPDGKLPDLDSFAAITDEPEPEVAATGHDRTIINIKSEYVDAWLNPQGDRAAMQFIFDDKRHPYYEHRKAA